jgi:hypothetical protein
MAPNKPRTPAGVPGVQRSASTRSGGSCHRLIAETPPAFSGKAFSGSNNMLSYLKLALKVLGRRKVFTFISLFGVTMTLVVLVIASAVLDDIFEPRNPESRFDRVLGITRVSMIGPENSKTMNPGFGLVHDYIYTLPSIEAASAYSEPRRPRRSTFCAASIRRSSFRT